MRVVRLAVLDFPLTVACCGGRLGGASSIPKSAAGSSGKVNPKVRMAACRSGTLIVAGGWLDTSRGFKTIRGARASAVCQPV